MVKLAIIVAGSWKGTSSVFPNIEKGLPEPLLPLGNGETVLSRLARQLRDCGFIVFAGIGQPGSLYSHNASLRLREKVIDAAGAKEGAAPPGPWTWERVEYVRSIGCTPILLNRPSGKSYFSGVDGCISRIGLYGWDQLMVVQGDMVMRDELMRVMTKEPCPSQLWMNRHKPSGKLCHITMWWDVERTETYLQQEPYDPNSPSEHCRHNEELRRAMEEVGAPIVCVEEKYPDLYNGGWVDIDYPAEYRTALGMIKHWMN